MSKEEDSPARGCCLHIVFNTNLIDGKVTGFAHLHQSVWSLCKHFGAVLYLFIQLNYVERPVDLIPWIPTICYPGAQHVYEFKYHALWTSKQHYFVWSSICFFLFCWNCFNGRLPNPASFQIYIWKPKIICNGLNSFCWSITLHPLAVNLFMDSP